MNRKRILIILALIFTFFIGGVTHNIYSKYWIGKGTEIKNNADATTFLRIQEIIENDFEVEGYEALFAYNETYDVAVPPDIAGIDGAEFLYKNHRQYIYKNEEKATVMLLGVSVNDGSQNKR